jgi:rod shape-determining protein MreD
MVTHSSRPIATYRVRPTVVAVTAVFALLLQTFLPLKLPLARLMDFPLLVTIYFTLLRRDKLFGIGLGTGMGLLQDALAHGFIGIFGISKAIAGYLAAFASSKLEFEALGARTLLIVVIVLTHSLSLAVLQRALLDSPPPFQPLTVASAVLVNAALGLILFQILDRFRHSD